MSEQLLEVRNLKTSFYGDGGEVKAVDGVSLDVAAGETVGIVGESGCGKSVMSLSILQLLKDTSGVIKSGEIVFKKRNLLNESEATLYGIRGNEIAMIFQEPMTSLNPVLKIGEQIEEAIRLHLNYSPKDARKRVIDMLETVGIPRARDVYREFPHQLSGGMRQRVMIALAMSCDPDLLIADEPTTALDVTIQAQILDLMIQLKTRKKMAVMLITHDLAIVAEMCDRVVVMYAGRVVESADIYSIFESPGHPYTIGLHHSIPKLDQTLHRLDSIKGVVPNPKQMPAGCKFAPRCQQAMKRCLVQEPPFFTISETQTCRCWLHENKQR